MKRKVIAASLRDAPTIHPISGESTLNAKKNLNIEMYTGIEAGMLTIFYQNEECAVPLSNVKGLVWEKEDADRMGGDKQAKAKSKESESAFPRAS